MYKEGRFELVSEYKPTGDQPKAIDKLVKGIEKGKHEQVLLGATGTGTRSKQTHFSICS